MCECDFVLLERGAQKGPLLGAVVRHPVVCARACGPRVRLFIAAQGPVAVMWAPQPHHWVPSSGLRTWAEDAGNGVLHRGCDQTLSRL